MILCNIDFQARQLLIHFTIHFIDSFHDEYIETVKK